MRVKQERGWIRKKRAEEVQVLREAKMARSRGDFVV
jgi:hypothetical protein